MNYQLHGGNYEMLETELDFSANINPLGIPDNIRAAVISSADKWGEYPDPYCRELCKKLSEYEDIAAENIVCGNGASDIIYRIVQALRPHKAVICAPSFGEYKKALIETGCEIHEHFLLEENDFFMTDPFLDELEADIDIAFICTPNNPTGALICPQLMKKIAEKCLKKNIILISDECFLDFAENSQLYTMKNFMNENIIILKAFTKIFAIPGLRLGYGLFGSSETAEKIRNSGQFWSVSAPAQAAGIAAFNKSAAISDTVKLIAEEREYLSGELASFGFRVYPSEANFILFKSRYPLYEMLLREKILIRSCAGYSGLGENYFRIAVRTHGENIRLIEAIRRILNG